jgi:hypothetical protein
MWRSCVGEGVGGAIAGQLRCMAAWIDSNVDKVTMEFLSHQRQAA